jgi:hypothetical protein
MATGIAAIGCRFKKNAEPFIVWMIDRKRLERIPDQAAGAFCAHPGPRSFRRCRCRASCRARKLLEGLVLHLNIQMRVALVHHVAGVAHYDFSRID